MNILRLVTILFATLLLGFVLADTLQAQKVEVDQSYIDSSAKAFAEVLALRKLDEARQAEIKAKDALISSKDEVITTKNLLIAAQDVQIKTLTALKCNKSSFLIFVYRSKKCY